MYIYIIGEKEIESSSLAGMQTKLDLIMADQAQKEGGW